MQESNLNTWETYISDNFLFAYNNHFRFQGDVVKSRISSQAYITQFCEPVDRPCIIQ